MCYKYIYMEYFFLFCLISFKSACIFGVIMMLNPGKLGLCNHIRGGVVWFFTDYNTTLTKVVLSCFGLLVKLGQFGNDCIIHHWYFWPSKDIWINHLIQGLYPPVFLYRHIHTIQIYIISIVHSYIIMTNMCVLVWGRGGVTIIPLFSDKPEA